MRNDFTVTYEVCTEESCELGDDGERGYINEGSGLREALTDVFGTRTSHVDGVFTIEANDSDAANARWVSVYNSIEYMTGAYETRSIHIPDGITGVSRKRIVRLVERGYI